MAEIEGEEWRPIPGYDGLYDVSNLGRIRSWSRFKDGALLKHVVHRNGNLKIGLQLDGKKTVRWVRQLVLEAFVGPRPPGMVAIHADGVKTNVTLSNLRWDTPREKTLNMVRHGTHSMSRRTHCIHGHEFTEDNTKWVTTERWRVRQCLTCKPLPMD